jgi:hypothetical protein
MRRWWLVMALLLSVGLNVGIFSIIAARRLNAALKGPKPPAAEMNNPAADPLPRLPRLADRLGLEGEERRRFLDIQWNLYQETSHLRLQLGEVHRALRRELTRPTPDKAEVDRLLAESSRIYLALERALVSNVLATRELLGPDKEKDYLRFVGQLRVPNPGGFGKDAGLGPGPGRGPGGGRNPDARPEPGFEPGNPQPPPDRPDPRMRRRWNQRFRQRFPGPGNGPP